MSETHDISESEAQSEQLPLSLDFGPLIENDTENIDIQQVAPAFKPARPRRRRLWIVPLVILLLILLVGGGVFAYIRFTAPSPVTYTQAAATIGNIVVTASATGPVQASAVYNMNFTASGQIQEIDVHVGEQVKQGQVLAKLNSSSLQDAVNQAQQNVYSAETSIGTAQSSLGNAYAQESAALKVAYDNEQNALNACSTATNPTPRCTQLAQDQYYQARLQAYSSVTSASGQVASAQQQLSSVQAALQTAKDNLNAATLTAPHAGTIEAINGVVGENAGSSSSSSSSSTSSAFIVLVDASTLDIAAQVNEASIGNVAVNQPATFTVAAYPSQTFRASVSSIDTEGQTSSNVVTYTVNLAVDMQSLNNAHVYPGMTATVNITTAERIGTLLVPASALTFSTTAIQNGELSRTALRSLASGSSTTTGSRGIVVELQKGKLVPVLVTTGLTNGQYTEILSGLKEGDQVIVSQTGGTTATSSSSTSGGTRFSGGSGVPRIVGGG